MFCSEGNDHSYYNNFFLVFIGSGIILIRSQISFRDIFNNNEIIFVVKQLRNKLSNSIFFFVFFSDNASSAYKIY